MNFNLPDSLMTHKDVKRALQSLNNLDVVSDKDQAYSQLAPEAQALVDANKKSWQDSELNGFKDMAEEFVKQAPVFDVILPTYPHDSLLKEVVSWFRREIHVNSLLNVSVRRSIGGGLVLRSKNRMFDMSFRPKILDAKDKIPEVLRRV